MISWLFCSRLATVRSFFCFRNDSFMKSICLRICRKKNPMFVATNMIMNRFLFTLFPFMKEIAYEVA